MAALAWFSLARDQISPYWLVVPLVLFLALVIHHERLIRGHRRAKRASELYEQGLARLEDRWSGAGEGGERFIEETHPYSEDLDLFGRGSLFELLCTARTAAGEETLADWLRIPAPLPEILQRQESVRELGPKLDLREEVGLAGKEVRAALNPKALSEWGTSPSRLRGRALRALVTAIGLAGLGALIGWPLGAGPWPFLALFILGQTLTLILGSRVGSILRGVVRPGRDLDVLAHLLSLIERSRFESAQLRKLQVELETRGTDPSRRVKQLDRLIEWLDAQRNMFFAPVALVVMWPVQMAFAIEAWRAKTGPALGRWLKVTGVFEALCALATFHYERPENPFPEFTEEGVCFEGQGLGHPLLPADRLIRNDVRLGRDLKLMIVSGSNMSGKSTWLRTVGTNTVLAQAGAPVRAARLRLSPLVLGASIRVLDSLQAGSSRFYAEITRIRQIVALSDGTHSLLFLLDEILHGTNSHDRRIGAAAVVRSLARRGAVGLITTHDLALARIAEEPGLQAANFHFEDHLEEGRIRFDYLLRPGVVQKSNALALMRSIGLEV